MRQVKTPPCHVVRFLISYFDAFLGTSAYHVSSCRPPASAFTIPEEALSEMRWLAAKRLWDYTMSVPELALISWTMQVREERAHQTTFFKVIYLL